MKSAAQPSPQPRFDSHQRQRILLAAIPVFAQRGVDGTSIRDLGRAAKTNSALLYYYFENKSALYRAAVAQVVGDLLDRLQPPASGFASGEARLRFLVEGVFRYYSEFPERMQLMGVVHTQEAELLGSVIEAVLREDTPLPLQIIVEGMRRGQLRRGHPVHVWWSLLGACVFTLLAQRTLASIDRSVLPFAVPSRESGQEAVVQLMCGGCAV